LAAVPEPGDVGERRDPVGASRVAVRRNERLQEIAHPFAPHPFLVEVLEAVEETVDRELRDPDRVEDGQVGRLPVGDRVGQRLVQRGQRHRDEVDLDVVRGRVTDQLPPWPLGDGDPHFGLVRATAQPVRIDERPPAAVPEDDALICEL
jgi:hypothetical protein